MADSSSERRFKLVVLGSTGVGKTCLTLRFVRGVFEDDQLPTIGAAYLTKSVRLRDAATGHTTSYVYEIWDTAGQERYDSITPLYYRTAQAAVIAFDVNEKQSFQKAKDWLARLRKEMDVPAASMPIALAANKCEGGESQVDLDEAELFAQENDLKLFKVSAKSGSGVDEMFQWLAVSLPQPVAAGGAQGAAAANIARPASSSKTGGGEACCS